MNYDETIEYLYSQLPVFQKVGGSAYKEGLDNSLALDEYFSHPHAKYKTIHVAGTNGKGSTSHILAAILQSAGYKVGLYTSPHLVDFRERIRINGEKISEQYVVDFVAEHHIFYESIHPSFFELTMTMAFKYFADTQVDVAIIEVGLGGRLDSTNIITPDLGIVTNISFDHTQFLGDTLEKIAEEKAGIIKPNIPIIIGEAEGDVRQVFQNTADRVGAPIRFAEDENIVRSWNVDKGILYIDTSQYANLKNGLSGYAQLKNTATILCAIDELKKIGYTISDNALYDGFEHIVELTGLMGRWQIIQHSPKIICDTGHNVGGVKYIVEQLKNEKYRQLHFILGVVNDKDISGILTLLPKDANYYFVKASIPRALGADELKQKAQVFGLEGDCYPSVDEGAIAALKVAGDDDLIFVGGSNFTVGDALMYLCK